LPDIGRQQHAAKAEHEAAPLQRRHPLVQKTTGEDGCQDWLQARNDRRQTDRHLMRYRQHRAGEIEPLNQKAGDDIVPDTGTIRPCRSRQRDDQTHDRGCHDHPHGEIGQRLRAVQHILGADEAGAPQQHEQHGRGRGDEGICLFIHGLLSA
jgi:hypothetical protein